MILSHLKFNEMAQRRSLPTRKLYILCREAGYVYSIDETAFLKDADIGRNIVSVAIFVSLA